MNRMGKEFLDNESGATAAFCALIMVVLCGFAALAIDYGQIVYVKRELTKAAEAGALSGARGLWPQDLSSNPPSRDPNPSTAATMANQTAVKNLPTTDVVTVEVGNWNYINTFTPALLPLNGVRVTTRRNNVPTIFAQVLPILLGQAQQPINIERSATAIMDFAIAVGGTLPIVVNWDTAGTFPTTVDIIFSPDMSDNAGWFRWGTSNPNATQLIDYINGSGPEMKVGDLIQLDNGGVTSALQELENKWNANKLPDGSWTVSIPVVASTVDKFVGGATIVSFVAIKITNVNAPPYLIKGDTTKRISATVLGFGETPGVPGPVPNPTGVLAPPRLVQ